MVEIDRERLGLETREGIDVRVDDGRLGLRGLDSGSRDLVVGDAFGGISVPWHLTTREAMTDVRRVLDEDGVYAVNLIDFGDLAFARAKVATMAETFDHVAVVGAPSTVGVDSADPEGGNMVAVASGRPLDLEAIETALASRGTGWSAIGGDDVSTWVGDAQVLTDDHAPVDQLLQPYDSQQ